MKFILLLFLVFSVVLLGQPLNSPFPLDGTPTVTAAVNAANNLSNIAPNTWVSLYGTNLALPGDSRPWLASDFINGQLPTSLDGVTVKIGGRDAYVAFISPTQINVLTSTLLYPGPTVFDVSVTVSFTGIGQTPCPSSMGATYCYTSFVPGCSASGTCLSSNSCSNGSCYSAVSGPDSPAFFVLPGQTGENPYVTAEPADGSLVGPGASVSLPVVTTPAKPGEEIVLYANGLGPVSLSDDEVLIAATSAEIKFIGLISPGLYQINVVVPTSTPNGDNSLSILTPAADESYPTVLLSVQSN